MHVGPMEGAVTPFHRTIMLSVTAFLAALAWTSAAASPCNLTVLPNVSCTQGAFAWTNATDFAACCADCAAEPACFACEWSKSQAGSPKACHLKATPGRQIAQNGTTCGISKSLPPVVHRYTPCSYSVLHGRRVPSALDLPTPKSASASIYTAQSLCDADDACGGWSVIAGKATLVKPFVPSASTTAPPDSLLYSKHCGPWVDPTPPTVWPLPATVSTSNGTATLAPGFELVTSSTSALLGRALARYKAMIFDHEAAVLALAANGPAAPLETLQVVVAGNGSEELVLGVDESYSLTIPADCVATPSAAAPACQAVLHSNTVFGALRGLETFAQLVRFDFEREAYFVPGAPIVASDQPRFAYRGLMLDTARHYFPVAVVRQVVDALSFAKFNVLHLHLSDDQSFPFVSRAHPSLARAAFGPTEKYTLADLAALARYARDRGVMLVGEFDAPGHATSWCTAYPQLCPSPQCMAPMVPSGNFSYDIIAALAQEVGGAFGSGMYHGGGDEVQYDCWESTPQIKAWMASEGFANPQEAYAYFLARVAAGVAPNTPVFWQDAFERAEPATPLPASTIFEFYKTGPIAAAADAGHRVIFANNHAWGLDIHTAGKTWDQFYSVDPAAGLNATQAANLLGGEACVWTVMIEASDLSSALWPRLLAVAERLWSPSVVTQNATRNHALTRIRWARCMLNSRGIPAGSALGNLVPEASPLYGSCLLQ